MAIEIFDTLAHPTLDGDWLGRGLDASFEHLASELEANDFCGACAVGLHHVGGFEPRAFAAACRRYPKLVPIAGFDPAVASPDAECRELKALGYRGIKIHPRFSGVALEDIDLPAILTASRDSGLVTLICTYFFSAVGTHPRLDPYLLLVEALAAVPGVPVVLVHGGAVDLLRYAELARHNDNILLDLSLTMMKYEDSSLDADIRFLFQRFDRRISIGSDHPEWKHADVRRRFEQFAEGIPVDKVKNIAFRNAHSFFGI